MSKNLYNLLKEIQQHLKHDDDSVKSQQLANKIQAELMHLQGWVNYAGTNRWFRNYKSAENFYDANYINGFSFEQAIREYHYWEKLENMTANEKHNFLIKNGWANKGIIYWCENYSGRHFRYESDLGGAFDREIQYQKSNLDYSKVLE